MTSSPHAATPIVEVRGLVKRYGSLAAVAGVDLTVNRGDVYGLLGPNGAGKTTLMRVLLGLVRPHAGTVSIDGRSVLHDGVAALQRVAGFVETPRFYPYLSGRRNLAQLARLDGDVAGARDRSGTRAVIDEALETVDLTDRAGSKVGTYSYGMVQRLGVAAALMRRPELLVLDEPTNGLDPAGIRDMRGLVARLAASGLTVLLSSHQMAEVDEMCERVAIMAHGKIAFDGPISELRARSVVVEHHLDTTDNAAALDVVRGTARVSDARAARDGIRFEAEPTAVERLSVALAERGVGVKTLVAPVTALETQFFRLTEGVTHGSADPAPTATRDGRAGTTRGTEARP